ncbi:MAG: hypothetical protein KDK76_07660, partial [Chlamydiia bacterium]|nr:hypothetical protein [Chlamydiia bacterium]
YALSALFFFFFYFANKKRFVEVFTEQKGFYLSAAAASASVIGGERYIKGFPNKGTHESAAAKALIVAMAALALRPASKILLRREVIHFEDAMKLGGVQIGAIVIPHAIKAATGYVPNLTASADNFEEEIGAIERVPRSAWEITNNVDQFDVDELLNILSDEDVITNQSYQAIYSMGSDIIIEQRQQNTLDGLLRMNGNDSQTMEAKRYANKIFGYLLLKLRAWEQARGEDKAQFKEGIKELIQNTIWQYINAHENCVDQVLSQILTIALNLVDDCGVSNTQKLFGLRLQQYRTQVIKKVVHATGERHGADLEIALAHNIYREMGWTMPASLSHGARYSMIYSTGNYYQAKLNFYKQYDPVEFLVNQMTYFGDRKAYGEMGRWYQNNIFVDGLLEAQKGRIMDRLKKDPEGDPVDLYMTGFGNESDGAKLYFLVKSGVITV